jgi:hypothetical protein
MADALMKQAAEGTKTLKPDFEANVRYSQVIGAEQLFSFFDAPLDQILVGCLVEGLPEQSQEMKTRETCLTGDLVQIERMIVTMIDELARATQTLVNIRRSHLNFCFGLMLSFHRFTWIWAWHPWDVRAQVSEIICFSSSVAVERRARQTCFKSLRGLNT